LLVVVVVSLTSEYLLAIFQKKSRVAEILPHYVPFICWSGGSQKPSMSVEALLK